MDLHLERVYNFQFTIRFFYKFHSSLHRFVVLTFIIRCSNNFQHSMATWISMYSSIVNENFISVEEKNMAGKS